MVKYYVLNVNNLSFKRHLSLTNPCLIYCTIRIEKYVDPVKCQCQSHDGKGLLFAKQRQQLRLRVVDQKHDPPVDRNFWRILNLINHQTSESLLQTKFNIRKLFSKYTRILVFIYLCTFLFITLVQNIGLNVIE